MTFKKGDRVRVKESNDDFGWIFGKIESFTLDKKKANVLHDKADPDGTTYGTQWHLSQIAPAPDLDKVYYSENEWYEDAKKFGFEIEGWGITGGKHAHDDDGRIWGTWLSRFETDNDVAVGCFHFPPRR